MKRIIFMMSVFFYLGAFAKHTAINLTERGLNNITNKLIESYQYSKGTSSLTYKSKTVYESIPASFFSENKVLKEINKFMPLNQHEDFVFYINATPIKVDGNVAENSLAMSTDGTKSDFDINLKLTLENLRLSGDKIELCELKKWVCKKQKNLYTKISNFVITANQNLDIGLVLNVKVSHGTTKLSFKNLYTNLVAPKGSAERRLYQKLGISEKPIKLNINFSDFYLPPLKIYIDGEELIRNFSKLKESILVHKEFLGKRLAVLAGNFIAKDLVKMVNKDLLGSMDQIKTKFSVLDFKSELSEVRNQLKAAFLSNRSGLDFESNITMGEKISRTMKALISQAKYDISFSGARTGTRKNLELDFSNTFGLNGEITDLSHSLRNGKGKLTRPDFSKIKNKDYDIAVAISEPLLNGAIEALNKTNILQSILKSEKSLKGVYIDKVHLHLEGEGKRTFKFKRGSGDDLEGKDLRPDNTVLRDNSFVASRHRKLNISNSNGSNLETTTATKSFAKHSFNSKGEIVLVAEVRVKILELSRAPFLESPLESLGDIASNLIGAGLESGGEIWFPLEIRFKAKLKKRDYKTVIALEASNPVLGGYKLINTYGYPYKKMSGVVESGVLKAISGDEESEGLVGMLENLPEIDITPYLEVEGLTLKPKNIYIHKSGHIIITSDIECLDVNTLGGKK